MIKILVLTPKLRRKLKEPLGILIEGSFEETSREISRIVCRKKPVKLIAVGDQVSKNMLEHGIPLDVSIIDQRIMRKVTSPVNFKAENVFRTRNPAGTITDESWKTIKRAINCSGKSKVIVDGEEDLLTLVAVLSAPDGSIVIYGQPKRGVVIIEVNERMKQRFQEIIKEMKRCETGSSKPGRSLMLHRKI